VIKISVFYTNSDTAKFDVEYYCQTHMPLVQRLLGPALKGMSVDHGIAGLGAGSPAPFVAAGHLLFDSVEDFQRAFGPHAQEIMSDIPNYTNVQPTIQISEVKL
jgi:uncharacterized protein (TIGR02118 family)